MATYLVRAKLRPEQEEEFTRRLHQGEFRTIRPFGNDLTNALLDARHDPASGELLWEETCFCATPLAAERALVLDEYFYEIRTEPVEPGAGWDLIEDLPRHWS